MRSRPARSGSHSSVGQPGGLGQGERPRGPARRRSRRSSDPPGGQPVRRAGDRPRRSASRPSAPASSAAAGSQSRTLVEILVALADVGRVADDEVEVAGQVRRERVVPVAGLQPDRRPRPARCRPGWRGPRRARRRTRRSPRPSSGRAESSAASASAIGTRARAQVGDGRAARSVARAMDQGHLDQLLGLRPRDQHPPVDEQVERPERPVAQHVLEGLALEAARDHGVQAGHRSLRSPGPRGRAPSRRPPGHWPPGTTTGPRSSRPAGGSSRRAADAT